MKTSSLTPSICLTNLTLSLCPSNKTNGAKHNKSNLIISGRIFQILAENSNGMSLAINSKWPNQYGSHKVGIFSRQKQNCQLNTTFISTVNSLTGQLCKRIVLDGNIASWTRLFRTSLRKPNVYFPVVYAGPSHYGAVSDTAS